MWLAAHRCVRAACRCIWGFKAFADQLANATLFDWLWTRLGTALVLERRDGACAGERPAPCHTPALCVDRYARATAAHTPFAQVRRNSTHCSMQS